MRYLFGILFFLFGTICFSQNDSTKSIIKPASNRLIKYELCFTPYSGCLTPIYSYNVHKISNANLSGVQFKILIRNKFAIRSSAEIYYAYPLIRFRNEKNQVLEVNRQFKLGLEGLFRPTKKIRPYLFTDFAYSNTNTDCGRDYNTITNRATFASHDSLSFIRSNTNSYKLLIGGGIKFTGSGKGFVSIESGFGLQYYKQAKETYSLITVTDGKNIISRSGTPHVSTNPTGTIFSANIFRLTVGITL